MLQIGAEVKTAYAYANVLLLHNDIIKGLNATMRNGSRARCAQR